MLCVLIILHVSHQDTPLSLMTIFYGEFKKIMANTCDFGTNWICNQQRLRWLILEVSSEPLLLNVSGFESSQIFNLHIFANGIFGYLLNGKTTCIFDNFSFMNKLLFKGKLTLSSLGLQLY